MKVRRSLKKLISDFLIALYRLRGCKIGIGCQISTTTKMDLTNPKGVIIGDYTVISFRTSILTHDFINRKHVDTTIGSNCFIGAGVMIMPGVSIGDNSIVGAGSVVFTDVPSNTIVSGNPARVVARDVQIGRYGIPIRGSDELLNLGGNDVRDTRSASATQYEPDELLASYFGEKSLNLPFSELGIDSFALITLRAEIEETEGRQIADDDWAEIAAPIDLARFLTTPKRGYSIVKHTPTAVATRHVDINMPQMSMAGLSEAWFFKEVGDIHWSLITNSLGVKSREIADQNGNRLYATFISFEYKASQPLALFCENDWLDFRSEMKRFGAGLFFAETKINSSQAQIDVSTSSSFAKFGEEGDNTSLVKGQPDIPANFAISSLPDKPIIMEDYQKFRSGKYDSHIFQTKYDIIPIHDINGVGLLYFASYPIISEICTSRFPEFSSRMSPIKRRVMYFANSGSDGSINFHITKWDRKGREVACEAVLFRSDGKLMAKIDTLYVDLGRADTGVDA